ncbi:MAG: hypothetical protein A3F18_01755 [Legionellales bacterium RIFCSPHIGHO2_12_FULL_37_14]|nr:MAG: hypothetical protein A3F18_01755 [Legionellales bacterium RIFCSPHIGHO2_12_FULL_37_14]
MQLKEYASGVKWLHWVVAIIVIPMVLGSFYLEDIPKVYRGTAIILHKSFGFTVLCLMLIRLITIHFYARPALPAITPKWEFYLARVTQYALYLALICMPLSGWIMSTAAGKNLLLYGLFEIPFPGITPNKAFSQTMFTVHEYIAYTIICLLILHITGAVKHYFYNKDNVLASMWPWFRR